MTDWKSLLDSRESYLVAMSRFSDSDIVPFGGAGYHYYSSISVALGECQSRIQRCLKELRQSDPTEANKLAEAMERIGMPDLDLRGG